MKVLKWIIFSKIEEKTFTDEKKKNEYLEKLKKQTAGYIKIREITA